MSGLNAAITGLRAAQKQLDIIANNISNANTDNYTRKILPLITDTVGGQTVGVRFGALTRKVDLGLQRDLLVQVSNVSNLEVKEAYMMRIQQFHGPPDAETSIAAAMGDLRDDFARLADNPGDTFIQNSVVNNAITTSDKINGLSSLINDMRNEIQNEISLTLNRMNDLLSQVADLNATIRGDTLSGKSTASLQDARDSAVTELSDIMEVNSFRRGDGVLVVQTVGGTELANEIAVTLTFNQTQLGPISSYPNNNINGIYAGDPVTDPNVTDITPLGISGKLGALIELRDTILPEQQAVLDELAYRTALRFQAQGLTLFTDGAGTIPADTPPDPATNTPVTYIGFANSIQVNTAVLNDNSLVQQGTVATDLPVQSGSNEVIRRVVEFAFGEVNYQQAVGNVDLNVSGLPSTLQTTLGLFSQNQVIGTLNLSSYTDIPTLVAGQNAFVPANDQFDITFDDPRTGAALTSINIDLSAADVNFPIGGVITDGLDQIIAEINAQSVAAPMPAEFAVVASRTQFGQLKITSRANITIAADGANGMRDDGLALLGLTKSTMTTNDPYFEIQVGNDPVQRITIEPGDTEVTLLAKLEYDGSVNPATGVPGLFADIDAGTGFLTLRPGNDDSNGGPVFGGDIRLVGGAFTDGAGNPILQAIFGNNNPVADVSYQSETALASGQFVSFRVNNLGPDANINLGLVGNSTIIDFSQKMINRQGEEINQIEKRKNDETTFRDILQRQFLDDSGVNIEEELANLIQIQTAFAASAKLVTAIDEQFREFMNAI